MKFMEITGGFILPVNNDEEELIHVLEEHEVIWQEDLGEYGVSIAEKMVSKGMLTRVKEEKKTGYRPNLGDHDA